MAIEWYPQVYPVDYAARTDEAFYRELWNYVKYEISNIQGFEYDLRDMKESYAVLSKQAIALGRNDLLNEVLAGIQRVNAMTDEWSKIRIITNWYSTEWPAEMTDNATPRAYAQTVGGIFFQAPVDSLAYVYVYWTPIKDRFSNEYYTIRQLEKKFTPAEIIAVSEPYIPVSAAPAPVYATPTTYALPTYTSAPEYISPEDTSLITWFTESTPSVTPAISAPQGQISLAGFPVWSVVLLAGAGIFMFLSKGKGIKGRSR